MEAAHADDGRAGADCLRFLHTQPLAPNVLGPLHPCIFDVKIGP